MRSQAPRSSGTANRSEEHTSELQSRPHLVCRLLLEKKNGGSGSHHDGPERGGQQHISPRRLEGLVLSNLIMQALKVEHITIYVDCSQTFFFNYMAPPKIDILPLMDTLPT